MPPGGAGRISENDYVSIAALMLETNGARGGAQALTAATNIPLRVIAQNQAPAQKAAPQAKQQAKGKQGPPQGITVAGEVKNFAPVTDAMMRNPDPADWLMIRHDYKASNFSPLNQVTAANVGDLRLAWVWAMNEGGTNQPAPIVHNGTIFLNNTGNILQAIDGRTGELIWENRYGNNATGAAQRGMAMYDDKIVVSTSEAHLLAFDAKTGKALY